MALTPALAIAAPDHHGDELAPRYVLEAIEVRGNDKTDAELIRGALKVVPGMALSIDDPAFERSRYRLLSFGFFSEVRLRLKRGKRRGGVVLVVEVVERGTIQLTDVFFGVSEATDAWGGVGLAEKNLLGRGIGLQGAFVLGADPDVERGSLQQAYWLRLSAPPIGSRRLELSASFVYLDGSEFYRQKGPEQSSTPGDFLAIRYRRIGGTAAAGFDLARYTRLQLEYRGEAIESDVPAGAVRQIENGGVEPIEFGIQRGAGRLSVIGIVLQRDTRSDPVSPERGGLLTLTGETSTLLLGSTYDYIKMTASYRHFIPLRWGHIISPQFFGGVVFGEAPFFEKFFIGDLNELVPSRALGLNFSTLPSRDFFGTAIDSKRYEEFALRAAVEYIVPWFRGGSNIYSGDFFLNVGVLFLTSKTNLRLRDRPLKESIPIDLTINAGLRLDTRVGIFRLSLGNALGRIPF